jgi:hypothetical protein
LSSADAAIEAKSITAAIAQVRNQEISKKISNADSTLFDARNGGLGITAFIATLARPFAWGLSVRREAHGSLRGHFRQTVVDSPSPASLEKNLPSRAALS